MKTGWRLYRSRGLASVHINVNARAAHDSRGPVVDEHVSNAFEHHVLLRTVTFALVMFVVMGYRRQPQ